MDDIGSVVQGYIHNWTDKDARFVAEWFCGIGKSAVETYGPELSGELFPSLLTFLFNKAYYNTPVLDHINVNLEGGDEPEYMLQPVFHPLDPSQPDSPEEQGSEDPFPNLCLRLRSIPPDFSWRTLHSFVDDLLDGIYYAIDECNFPEDSRFVGFLDRMDWDSEEEPDLYNNPLTRSWYFIKHALEIGLGQQPDSAAASRFEEVQQKFYRLQ